MLNWKKMKPSCGTAPKKTDRKWREMKLFCDKIKNKGELDYEKMEITRREKESFKTIL